MQALQGEQILASLGRVGCPGVPRAVGSRVAQQETGPKIAAAADSVELLSSLAAQASGQAQAVAYTLLVMRLFEPHRSAPCAHIVCPRAHRARALAPLSDQVLTRIPEVFQLQLPVEVTPFAHHSTICPAPTPVSNYP